MFIKKLYNDLDTLVDESLEGQLLLYPNTMEIIEGTRFLVRRECDRKPKGYVKMVGGGGAGHEGPGPGFVGPGRYDLGIIGDVFAAPAANKVFRAISAIDDGSPIILGVTNHTGDILNSRLAVQMCRAKGIDVHMHVIYNDVASAPKGQEKDRRAIGGAYNVTMMMAEWGESLEDILRVSEKTNQYTRSYGVGIRSAIHPESGLPIMEMPEDEIELGIGVHGESSGERIKLPRSKELARIVCDKLLDDLEVERGEELVLSLQGLGGMTWMELYIFYKDVFRYMEEKGIKVYRASAGNSGTQELGGLILSIGRLDEEMKYWLNKKLPDRFLK